MNLENFYFVYILELFDNCLYTGYTANFKKRITQHRNGDVQSTKNKRPIKLIYFEACLSKKDAIAREKYLKKTYGKQRLKKRLKHYLEKSK